MKKTILICGATGFIGRNMLEYFIEDGNYNIRAVWHMPSDLTDIYSDNVEWINADLTKKEDVKKVLVGVDIILQYAAISTSMKDAVERPYIHVTDNVIINSLIFRYAYEVGVEQVIFPSCTVMYDVSDYAVREEDFNGVMDSDNIYFGGGGTKVYLENMCKFYSKLGNTKFTVMRQTHIYGPYDEFNSEGHFFPATVDKVINSDGEIIVWGDGTEEKDLLYVKDLADFIKIAIETQKSNFELVNIGSGSSFKIKDIVKNIIDTFGKKIEIKYDLTKPSRKKGLKLNTNKVKNLFNWETKYTLTTGINEIMNKLTR